MDKLLIGSLILIGLLLLFIGVDVGLGEASSKRSGLVVGKNYCPSRTSTSMIYNGKTMTPIVTVTPEKYILLVKVDGDCKSISVDSSEYASIKDGSTVDVYYVLGRFTGWCYACRLL